jgi:hypothetical protein
MLSGFTFWIQFLGPQTVSSMQVFLNFFLFFFWIFLLAIELIQVITFYWLYGVNTFEESILVYA